MAFIKYILSFLLFSVFFYLDSALDIEIYSHAWKAILVIFITVFIVVRKGIVPPSFIKIRIIWSLQQIANIGSLMGDFMMNGLLMIRWLMLPLMYLFFERKYLYSPEKLYKLLITIAQFFALSNIPFLLGLLEPATHETVISDMEGFTGIFGAIHTTAAVMSTTMVILLYHLTHRKLNMAGRIYNAILAAISIYATYAAFTRTGWTMLIAGILIMFMPTKFKVKHAILFCAIIGAIGFTAARLYNDVEYVKYRIEDIDPDTEYELLRGSGRNFYREVSLNLWKYGSFSEKVFGVGLTRLMDNMKSVVGVRIFTHNGYIDALVANGILGLSMMILYILSLFVFLIKHRHSQYSRVGFTILVQYILYQFVQGHNVFATDLLYALILSLIVIDSRSIPTDHDNKQYPAMQ